MYRYASRGSAIYVYTVGKSSDVAAFISIPCVNSSPNGQYSCHCIVLRTVMNFISLGGGGGMPLELDIGVSVSGMHFVGYSSLKFLKPLKRHGPLVPNVSPPLVVDERVVSR